jgi:LDH2 family malate/lactate/ureidoglycolate dehydrogenase
MAEPVRLGLDAGETLAYEALVASGTAPANARATARALVAAEADGQTGHGLSRVPSYALQARTGKVDGHATPRLEQVAGAALRVDGGFGFAYPAIDLAIAALAPLARSQGIAAQRSTARTTSARRARMPNGWLTRPRGDRARQLTQGHGLLGGRRPTLEPILAFAAPLPGGVDPS